jgi:hypothetical protein
VVADPDTRSQLAKEGRLWLLSLVCATIGALTVWLTSSIPYGVGAFVASVLVLGGLLRAYEKRRRQ